MAAVPQVAIIVWFGLARSGWTCEDQASLEVGSFHVFWHITLPRVLPLVLAGIVWVTIVCAREIAVTDIYRIGTVAEQIYLGYSLGEFDGAGNVLLPVFGMVPSLAVMVLISAVAVIAIFNYPDNYFQSGDWKPDRMPVAQARHVVISTVMLMVLIVVPMTCLVARASKAVELVDGTPLVQYSWLNLASVVSHVPVRYVAEFQWSTCLALLSSVASMLLAVGMAWKACESRRWTGVMFVLVAITSGIPGPLIGSALLDARALLDFPFWHWLFDRTILAPVMANLVFCWPVSSLLVWAVLRSTAKGALESARLEGATSLVRLVRIAVASNLLPLIGCWLLVFAISFGELSASQLAIPPGIDTIPRRMLGLLHAGVNNETAGLTIVVFALVILVCVAGWRFVRWFGWRNSP
jgi:iron(III) transport system permease protein